MAPDETGPRPLAHVDVVLVRPRGSANVGAAARAIANHGLGRLVLVAPPALDPEQARWMAPGARDVFDGMALYDRLEDAVEDRVRVVGTSGRPRRWSWPVRQPWELARVVLDEPVPTAIVFGQEDFGMSNEDLSVCSEILTLPTAGHASLNLAQAVTVTASWLLGTWCQDRDADPEAPPEPPAATTLPAPQGLRDAVIEDVLGVLEATGYLESRSPLQVRATLHQLLARVQPSVQDAGMLRGMLKPSRWRLGLLPTRS